MAKTLRVHRHKPRQSTATTTHLNAGKTGDRLRLSQNIYDFISFYHGLPPILLDNNHYKSIIKYKIKGQDPVLLPVQHKPIHLEMEHS